MWIIYTFYGFYVLCPKNPNSGVRVRIGFFGLLERIPANKNNFYKVYMGKSGTKLIKCFFFHGWTEMFLKHQRELTKCVICKVLPNIFTAYHFSMNNDNPRTLITVSDEVYIICKICEKYIHFKCYSSHLKLSAEQGQQDGVWTQGPLPQWNSICLRT